MLKVGGKFKYSGTSLITQRNIRLVNNAAGSTPNLAECPINKCGRYSAFVPVFNNVIIRGKDLQFEAFLQSALDEGEESTSCFQLL